MGVIKILDGNMKNKKTGTQKLTDFYDKHPIRVIWMPFVIMALFIIISFILNGKVIFGIVLILLQVPWLLETMNLFNEHMECYDD